MVILKAYVHHTLHVYKIDIVVCLHHFSLLIMRQIQFGHVRYDLRSRLIVQEAIAPRL